LSMGYLANALIVLQLAVFLFLAVFHTLLDPLNQWFRNIMERRRDPRLRTIMVFSHRYNDLLSISVQLLMLAVLVGLFWKDGRRATILTMAILVQLLIIGVIKKLTSIGRPPQSFSPFFLNSGSYPSGHSSASMTFALLVPIILTPYVPIVLLIAVSVYLAGVALITAYGRLFLDVHWLTDIIGGWMLSGATFLLCRGLI
jgi:membrane-associated phospholipid phosphatase